MSSVIFKEFSVRAVCQLDDQCRGSSVKEKDNLAGKVTNLYCAIGPIFSVYGQRRLEDICSAPFLPHCHTHLYSHVSIIIINIITNLPCHSSLSQNDPFYRTQMCLKQIVKIPATTLQTC